MYHNRMIVLALLLALVGVAVATASEDPVLVPPPTATEYAELERNWQQLDDTNVEECVGATDNLLINPSFEGEYDSYTPPVLIPDCPWGICMSAQMADGWTPYWKSHDNDGPSHLYRMPEWKAATTHFTNPPRVRSGERAQQWFTFYSTHQAGIYQQIEGAIPGNNYCLSVWGHAWSSNGGSYTDPSNHGFLNQQIGIDPTGGTDYTSSNIIWTSPRTQYDEYGLFKLTVPAESDKLTVFFHSEPLWAWQHNDAYYDDAILVSLEAPEPATMVVSPESLWFSAETEFPLNRTSDPINIRFTPAYDLSWTASILPDGAFAPTLTRTSGKSSDTTSVQLDTTELVPGSYKAQIEFRSSAEDTINSPSYVDINLTVTQSPARFDIGSATMGSIVDDDVPQTVTLNLPIRIKNADAATWTATSDGTWWMQLQTPSGNNGSLLQVDVASHGLPVGVHTATVTLTGHNADFRNQSQDVTISLVVAEEVSRVYVPVVAR